MRLSTFADIAAAIRPYWPNPATLHRYGLEHMYGLLDYLGNPHKQFRVVHVAGTSGKTSTAYYTAALLRAAGKHVGLTISPHVDEVNERVQIDLVPLPEALFAPRFGEYLELVKQSGVTPNYFELFIAFAFWEFAAHNVEYAVVEVGIGGLLDSTNVVTAESKVCIITDIGFDHMSVLGTTLPEIAAQKAGIIQLHNPVFCYDQSPEVTEVVRRKAAQKQADLHVLDAQAQSVDFAFLPLFQQRNFGLARAAATYIGERDHLPPLTKDTLTAAAHTAIPARMEQYELNGGKLLIVDAAHNYQKFQALLASIHAQFGDRPLAAMVRMSATDKHSGRMARSLRQLFPGTAHIIVTSLAEDGTSTDTHFAPRQVARICQAAGYTSFAIIPNPIDAFQALQARPETLLVIAGSFYLLNHIRPLLPKHRSE
jgi:dihydrofolate synthase / folylpolyglutamate synthase